MEDKMTVLIAKSQKKTGCVKKKREYGEKQ
jgi:hypothetical protein